MSKHPNGVPGPLKITLPNPERICSRPNATKVNINPQISNMVMQLGHTSRSQHLVTRLGEETDIVGSFLAPNRQVKNKVLSDSRNSQRGLPSLRGALPANY